MGNTCAETWVTGLLLMLTTVEAVETVGKHVVLLFHSFHSFFERVFIARED